jgi:hypothetical protein
MKILLIFSLAGLLLVGCGSLPAPEKTPTSLESPDVQNVTATPDLKQNPAPSPTTILLPLNSDTDSNEYCKPPYAVLPVEDGNDISENEIVYELVKIWLRRYKQPAAPALCRIADFTIDNVYDDPGIYSKVLEPRGDFKRVVVFSVKPVQVPSDWMNFAGELDQKNWMHVSHIVAITETSEGYKLEFAYP